MYERFFVITNLTLTRHLLYDSEENLTPIKKEVEFIQSDIALMRLRFTEKVIIDVDITDAITGASIPPLLFTSLLENAFKYGTDYNGKTMVKINFSINEGSIHFRVVNKIGNHRAKSKSSGLGLENVNKPVKIPISRITCLTN